MAVDPQGKDSTLPSLDSLIAAGGNSSAARSLRVKSQLRDRLGRWVEMGRDSKLSFLDKLGNIASTVGKFLGNSDREGYGRFYVNNDPILGTGVYEFPSESIEQVAATLDENYLVSKNIDVNGNKVKGLIPSDGIPKFADLVRTDLTPEDQDVIDNPVTAEEKDVQVKARLEAPAYESKKVIARIDDADLEDLRKNNVDWSKYIRPYDEKIDKQIGFKPEIEKTEVRFVGEEQPKKPDVKIGFERDVPGVPFAKPVARLDSSETPVDEDLGSPVPKDDFYDRRRKDFQDTITEANPELAASLFGDNPDAELKKNVEAELDKIDKDDNFNVKFSAYESVAQALLEGTFTPSSDDKMAWYPVVGKDNHTIGILDGNSFYAKPQGNMLIVTGDGANNRVESLEQFEELAPSIIAANRENLVAQAKRDLSVYDTDGEIANAIDSGATSAEIQPLLEKSPQYIQDRIFAEESQRKNFLSPDERAASTRIASSRTALKNVDKVNKNKPAEKARLEPEQSGLDGVLKKLEDAGITEINNPNSEDENILQARDTAMYMSDLIEEAGANGEVDKADLYDRLANSLLEHFKNKGEGKAAKPKVVGKADSIQKITGRKEGATLDPMTLKQPRKGISVALQGDNEEVIDTVFFDEKLGNLALAKYLDDNKAKFRDGFKLGTWHDKDNNEVTLDVIELFPEANQAEAETAGQERNQQGIFKLSNKEYISTGGTGDRGRARKERELARQSGDRVDSVGRLGDEDLGGESRVSSRPKTVTSVPDEWSADSLRVNGIIPNSAYAERYDKGKELGQILPSSEPLINVPVTGDVNQDAKNIVRASRQLLLDGASSSPRKQRKFEKRFDEIQKLLLEGETSSALEKLSNLGMDYSNFYHSGGRDRVFGIPSTTDASEASMDLYWYGRTAGKSLSTNVNPDSGTPRIESTESFALDVDDLGNAMLKSPTLSKDKDNVINVSQVISDLTNSTSTAQTVDTLQQVANSLINGYLKNENLKFEVGDIAEIVDSIANVVKKNKAKKIALSQIEQPQILESAPRSGEDLGGSAPTFKDAIDEIVDSREISRATAKDYISQYNKASSTEDKKAVADRLYNQVFDQLMEEENDGGDRAEETPAWAAIQKLRKLDLPSQQILESAPRSEVSPNFESLLDEIAKSGEITKRDARGYAKAYSAAKTSEERQSVIDQIYNRVFDQLMEDEEYGDDRAEDSPAWDAIQKLQGLTDSDQQRLDSAPSGEDEDLGGDPDKTTHLQQFKQLVDEMLADKDITEFFTADKIDYFYNRAELAQTPEEYTAAIKTLYDNIWAQMSRDEEWHEVEITENPLFPFTRRLGDLARTAPMNFEKLEQNQPDMSAAIAGDRLADIQLNTRTIDRSKLNESQKTILRSLVTARNNALKNLKSAAQNGNTSAYEFNYNMAFATTKTIQKLVANSEARGEDYRFGSGEADRISNFVVFEDSIRTTANNRDAENGEEKVSSMEGLYVSKSGKVYFMKWDGSTVYTKTIKKDGSIGTNAGYVTVNWNGEAARGADFKNSVTPGMLKTYPRYQQDGIGGASITFARLAAEKSGRHFAHSGTLTGMGANNSKGIDPADPDRHNKSQAEKVLWMMKAPIFDVMRDNGWFQSDRSFKLGATQRSLARFDLSLDPTGYRSGSGDMIGPLYTVDEGFNGLMERVKNDYIRGDNPVAGEDYPAFMKNFVEKKEGEIESHSLRRMITDMSYKDGRSVDDVINAIKEQREQLAEFKDKYDAQVNANPNIGDYFRRKNIETYENVISFRDELITLLENNKEKLDNVDSRIERPKPFAKDSFKTVKRSPYGDTSVGETQLKAIGKNAELINEAPDIEYDIPFINQGNYKQLTGKDAPEGWNYDSPALARRFDAETLRGALVNVLTSDKPVTDNFAEIDFGRKYGAPAVGYVSPRSVVLALVHQEGMANFNRWIASTMDGINGGDANVQAMRSKPNPKADLIAEMDKLLAKEGLESNRATPTVAESRGIEDSTYDPATRIVVSARRNSQFRGLSYNINPQFPLLPKNEAFDLDNGQDDVLGGTYNSNSAHAIQKRNDGGSNNPVYIANNFDNKALEDAFVDALNNRRLSVQLKFNDTSYVQNTEITAIRDALQHQGVDTNELVKKRVTSLRKPVDETSLNQIGRTIPEPVSSLVAHANIEINLDTFLELPGEIYGGVNAPTLMLDPATGKKYVVKRLDSSKDGWGSRAIDQEIAAQAFYRAMGVRASKPQRGTKSPTLDPAMTSVEDRHEYVVTEFIPASTGGKTYDRALHGWDRNPDNPILEAVRHGLPADILLDHIDGPFNSNNTVIDENGNIVRIDGGGALMWDPLPDQGPKGPEGREMRLRGNNNWRATDEQKALFDAANRDGTFEGEGVNFAFDFFLNPNGWHWMPGYNGRKRILEGLTDDQMKQYTKETVLPLTPDKIEAISEIIRDPNDRSRVARTLIARRKAILDRYGIEDDYSPVDEVSSPSQEQVSRFFDLVNAKITDDKMKEAYLAEFYNQQRAGKITAAELDNRISALQTLEKESVSTSPSATGAEISKFVELVYALYSEQEERDRVTGQLPRLPFGEKTGPWVRNKISEMQAMLAERAQPAPSAADAINEAEEARNAAIQNGVDTTIYGAHPTEAEAVTKPVMDLVFGDILVGMADENGKIKEEGRVVFNAVGSDGKRTVAYVDANKKVNFKTYDGANRDTEVILTYRYPQDARPMQSDITEGAANRELRNTYQNQHAARSTAILQDIKNTYPKHVELENGDLVVSSRDFTTAGGDTYKYEIVVHRKPNEDFVTYVRETPINAAGEVVGTTTVNKISVSTHSSTHLKNQIAPLVRGNTSGKGVFGRNPRNWFNQGNNRQAEVIHPGTGLPIPRSLAPEQLDTKYIGNTGIKATGDATKDALIGYVADLVDRKVETGSLLLRLSSQNIVSRSQINDIIERIQANRAFPGVNQIPYMSRDGENIVRVGDRVRHYATDGTTKEGVVRKRRPLSVNQKRSGTYGYSDVLVVKFDGRAQGTPIVAKHLEILRRADGSPASISGEQPEVVTEPPFLPLSQSAIDEGIVAEDINSRTRRFVSASNGRSGRITRLPRAYAAQDDTYSTQLWNRGADQNSDTPYSTTQFYDKNVAQAAVLNWLKDEPSENVRSQASSSNEDEDLGSPIDASPEPEVGKFEAMVNESIIESVVDKDGSTEVSFGEIDGISSKVLPTYNIGKNENGTSRLIYWGKPEDVGNLKKASYIKVPRNASKEQMLERIKKNAEDRILYNLEGKHVYELKLSDGTVITSDDINYEEFNSMFSSTVTGSHLKRDDKGKLVFDEGRIAAHTEILERLLSGVEPPADGKKKMFFLGGGPASGKGNFTGGLRSKYGVPAVRSFDDVTGEEESLREGETFGAVKIDPDEIKILLPEVREMHARQMMRRVEKALGLPPIFRTGLNDGKWAENSHEESSLLAKMLQKAAVQKGLNVVYDGTGDGKRTGIIDKIQPAKDEGYETVGLYMTTDLATAIGSAAMRRLRTGRLVPGTTQNEIYFALSKLIDPNNEDGNISELFDSWRLLHREPPKKDLETGKKTQRDPVEIATAGSGDALNIKDPALWAEFIKLGELSEQEVEEIIAKGQAYFRETKAERDNEREIALVEAGKDKLDASDLKDSDPRVLEIRSTIASIAAQTGLTAQVISANGALLRMILDNTPIAEIIAEAKQLRLR